MWRRASFLLLVFLALPHAAAQEQPPDVVLVTTSPTPGDVTDGRAEIPVTLLNVSAADHTATVAAGAGVPPGCGFSVKDALVPTATQKEVIVVAEGCPKGATTLSFVLTAGGRPFELKATRSQTPPDWSRIGWAFFVSTITSLALIGWVFARRPKDANGDRLKKVQLDATYDFSKSWAANATVAAAAFTAVLGKDAVTDALFGEEADAVVTLLTVASALAVAAVGVAPLVVRAATDAGNRIDVAPFLFAAFLTLAATGGELVTALLVGWSLVGIVGDVLLLLPALALVALLGEYSRRSLKARLTPPAPTAPGMADGQVSPPTARPARVAGLL